MFDVSIGLTNVSKPLPALARIDAIHARPRCVRMIVQAEEAAAARDVEPGVRVDQASGCASPHRSRSSRTRIDQMPPAEFLELLDRPRSLGAEQSEIAFEDLRVALP
jgi:hypothetical protein